MSLSKANSPSTNLLKVELSPDSPILSMSKYNIKNSTTQSFQLSATNNNLLDKYDLPVLKVNKWSKDGVPINLETEIRNAPKVVVQSQKSDSQKPSPATKGSYLSPTTFKSGSDGEDDDDDFMR